MPMNQIDSLYIHIEEDELFGKRDGLYHKEWKYDHSTELSTFLDSITYPSLWRDKVMEFFAKTDTPLVQIRISSQHSR